MAMVFSLQLVAPKNHPKRFSPKKDQARSFSKQLLQLEVSFTPIKSNIYRYWATWMTHRNRQHLTSFDQWWAPQFKTCTTHWAVQIKQSFWGWVVFLFQILFSDSDVPDRTWVGLHAWTEFRWQNWFGIWRQLPCFSSNLERRDLAESGFWLQPFPISARRVSLWWPSLGTGTVYLMWDP